MSRLSIYFWKVLVVHLLAVGVGLGLWLPVSSAGTISPLSESVSSSDGDGHCCCGTANGACCGQGCCGMPQPSQRQPCPANSNKTQTDGIDFLFHQLTQESADHLPRKCFRSVCAVSSSFSLEFPTTLQALDVRLQT